VYVLLEVSAAADPVEILSGSLEAVDGIEGVAVADDPVRRRALWRFREEHTLAIATVGTPHKLDVTLPLASLASFVESVPGSLRAVLPDAKAWMFGHIGDGNVHVNITGIAANDMRADEIVFEEVARLGGSISAEHGIGTAKKEWLHLSRSPEEIAAMRAIKHALDPDGLLNPNCLLPVLAEPGEAVRRPRHG
jgi:FAD/FMN-containing dehydrogenase